MEQRGQEHVRIVMQQSSRPASSHCLLSKLLYLSKGTAVLFCCNRCTVFEPLLTCFRGVTLVEIIHVGSHFASGLR